MKKSDRPLSYRDRVWFASLLTIGLVLIMIVSCGGCGARQYPGEAPTMMDPAVVRLTSIEHSGEEHGNCTAWKLSSTHMVTAGHCCEYEQPEEDADELDVLFGNAKTKTVNFPYFKMSGDHAIDGELATVVRVDSKHDICVLKGRMKGAPLRIAKHDPVKGARVFTAGYPHTTFLISEGLWSGRDDDDQGVASIAVWGGASGSPVMNDEGEVVGVLVGIWPNFDSLAFIAPLEWLRINVDIALRAGN